MNELQAATSVPLPKTQQRSSLQRAALCVAGRFFPGLPYLVEGGPDAMA
ncbi:MAG: hypothetical protein KF682_06030 [Nitrospira sp.]|nr:hypothetical protein [Nitrospira sp.]